MTDLYCTSSLVLHILTHAVQYVFLSESLEKGYKIWVGLEKKGTILTPDLLEKGVHFESSRTSMPFNKLLRVDMPGSETVTTFVQKGGLNFAKRWLFTSVI